MWLLAFKQIKHHIEKPAGNTTQMIILHQHEMSPIQSKMEQFDHI